MLLLNRLFVSTIWRDNAALLRKIPWTERDPGELQSGVPWTSMN